MKILNSKFFKFAVVCIALIFSSAPAVCAVTNLPVQGDVGDYGTWATENNLGLVTDTLHNDVAALEDSFNRNQMVKDYVPIEARVGLAFMNAMTWVGRVLDRGLVRFAIIFMFISFAFWLMAESYGLITRGDGKVGKLLEDIVKKGGLIAIWVAILSLGPAQIFMYIMGPVLKFGAAFSDLILNAVSGVIGTSLPDTCGAIHAYTAQNVQPDMLIDASMAGDIMCLPTRLSGFFYTAISAGFRWMWTGIGTSVFTFFIGVIFVVLFTVNLWKFTLMALGVIADLFLGIFMLPFTAIAATTSKTSTKGIVGQIVNGLTGILNAGDFSLQGQIARFINAAVYFVSLSVVIAICTALLSGTVSADLAASVPTLENESYIITILTGCLVYYLASNTEKIAKQLGGSITSSMGDKVGKDAVNLTKAAYKKVQEIIKTIRES